MRTAILMPDNLIRHQFITPEVARRFEELGPVTYNQGGYEPETIKALLADCDICVTGWGAICLDEAILSTAKNLKFVVHTGGTVATITSDYLYDRGIRVLSGNDIMAEGVAESTLAYIFAGLKQISFYNGLVQGGGWRPAGAFSPGLMYSNVGLVGFGAIARYLVPMLQPFNVNIRVYDPFFSWDKYDNVHGVEPVGTMEEVFASSDVVSLHLAQRPETYHIIGKDMLGLLKDGALLVNTARGTVIDEDALADELATGRISAVLDVFHQEPLALDSRLRGMDNCVLIPHMAGHVGGRYEMASLALLDDLERFINGQPLEYEISREYAGKMTV